MDPLPIENYSNDEFNKFKEKYLDNPKLSEEAIQQIKILFNLRQDGTVHCDEYHAHDYKCVIFKHPSSGIVDRLINEIEDQRGILKKIIEQASE